jgi:hypothetical protein
MASKSTPQRAQRSDLSAPRYLPHPDDAEEVRRAFEETERGELLDAETNEAILRWLETGEGPCP